MQSRFTFLENRFPKLAAYGQKAEESLGHDNNICLLNLGRVGETIAELLCIKSRTEYSNNAPENAQDLLRLGIIDEDICRKITALTEIMQDAAENEYSSEMAAARLLTTAQELCEWFMSSYGSSRFDFLADLFKAAGAIPPLADLADFAREAEENLRANTRYCLICLGDVGEEIADMLINLQGITIHERDQMQRIDLLHYRGVIDTPQKDILHELRMIRNKAVHNRYASEDDGKKLLDSSLPLCEWLFRLVVESGDIVRGYITSSDEEGLSVKIGQIDAKVPKDEIPEGDTFREGERKIFVVMDAESEDMSLSLKEVHSNPWTEAARKYAKYKKGQDVNAVIKRITNTSGAFAELNDGLVARLPESEYGTKFPTYSPRQGQHIRARVKWLNPEQYPYMLLSIRDAELTPPEVVPVPPMPKKKFIGLCKIGNCEEIAEAIDTGVDVNAANHNGVSALMTAVMYNQNPGVLAVLVERGADVNAKSSKGNTALMYAAMFRTAEVVRELVNYGADIETENEESHNALHYAQVSRRLRDDSELLGLLGMREHSQKPEAAADVAEPVPAESEPVPSEPEAVPFEPESVPAAKPVPAESETVPAAAQPPHRILTGDEFLALCKNGTPQEILAAVRLRPNRDNFFAKDSQLNNGFILAAEHNTLEAVNILIGTTINTNAKNTLGNNALMTAAAKRSADVVEALIPCTDDINHQNTAHDTALILAAESNNDPEVVRVLINHHADLNITENAGNTALMLAALKNTPEVVKVLLDAKADISLKNPQGNTALMLAAWKNTPEVAAALLDAGADISVKNIKGKTAYDLALTNQKLSGSRIFVRLKPALQSNILGICKSGNPEDIQEAINAGVNLNVINRNGDTPLIFAAKENSAEAVEMLITAGVEFNTQDNAGNTALIYAAAYNNPDVVSVLLDYGADKDIVNNSGKRAYDYALRNYRLNDTDIPKRLK